MRWRLALVIAGLAFLGIFGMALLGVRLRKILSDRRVTEDSKDTVLVERGAAGLLREAVALTRSWSKIGAARSGGSLAPRAVRRRRTGPYRVSEPEYDVEAHCPAGNVRTPYI